MITRPVARWFVPVRKFPIRGTIALAAWHKDGKADYSTGVGALAAAGAEHPVPFGHVDRGGKGIIQASCAAGASGRFVPADGMAGEFPIGAIGRAMSGSAIPAAVRGVRCRLS